MDGKPKNKIEELQKELYERDFKSEVVPVRQEFTPLNVDVKTEWEHEAPKDDPNKYNGPKVIAGSFFKKILIGSIIFFMLSAGLLIYMFYGNWNIISAERVDITFLGPVTIAAGSELDFEIVINNSNKSSIKNATLYIDYPDGTKRIDDVTVDLAHDKQLIGDIVPKGSARFTSRSIPFGELNSRKSIRVKLEYGLQNSIATFQKEKTFDVVISSTPLTLAVSRPQNVVSGDTVPFKVVITSNSSAPITNLLLRADYPSGFAYSISDPAPDIDKAFWVIPRLEPGEKKEFMIEGILQGEESDERVFRFTVGSQSTTNEKEIATMYLSQPESLFIRKPPLGVKLTLSGSSTPQYTSELGKEIQGVLILTNNLSERMVNIDAQVALSGVLYDPAKVSGTGFFQSHNNTIIWNKNNTSRLNSLEPGEEIRLSFLFALKDGANVTAKNGTMNLVATARGFKVSDSESHPILSAVVRSTVQSMTSISISPSLVYSTGPFRNKGPIPPKANVPTTFTVIWTARNTLNDVRMAEVRAKLGDGVRWVGNTSPQSEMVTWNSDKNEVVWRLGDVVAGTGIGSTKREVAFQIELTPNLIQVGDYPDILTNIKMTAVDAFTNAPITADSSDLKTRLTADPKFTNTDGKVTK